MSSSNEFFVESFISNKQLNNSSVSLVIPRITRDKIHNSIYYKVNLTSQSLRGNTMVQLIQVIVRDFGKLKSQSHSHSSDTMVVRNHLVGGTEFKCLLMKIIELKPTIEQIWILLEDHDDTEFDNKYITVLIITYIRIQYFFIGKNDSLARKFQDIFQKCLNNYTKLKCFQLDADCWSPSLSLSEESVRIIYMDEVVDWLLTKDNIWGIPLGKCQWVAEIGAVEEDSDSSSSSSSSSSSD
ncbi:U4/U6-U5 snRNP complex subunit PRP38 NDAI_0A06800 [Naumovozyma dairenensis CBS 421]|uniref:Pre-mRNA-splicing factor 38 n=1 Tax=Naumovozyma dairenensis (strain ATCC 10597 / BCRC 20456 / CBS 421 / NBRC 0211 / NRRL Y-12639) TaxID=1071378 RepID=G0W4U6_NAUDC|nr:hypothetical protein NDAI_0A06800 [Naumovozyma dairenensis CBS 421]CCD22834.1 hypothetical protein NDAI_0A06800 [Naumovozyma dairenensis CBS 421]